MGFPWRIAAGAPLLLLGCTLALGDLHECEVDVDCADFAPGGICMDGVCGVSSAFVDPCGEIVGGGGGEVVRLGALLPMTTDGDTLDSRGPARRDAMKLAIDEINAREGAAAVRFELRVCDSAGGDRDRVRALSERLLDEGAVALLTTGTGDTLAAFGGARERGGLVMSVSATSKELTDLTDDGLVWRTAPSDVSQGQVLAQQVDRALGPDGADRRVAIFEANTVYANGLRSVFKDHLVEAGDTREFLFDEGGADLDSRLGEANGYDPDVAVIIAGPTDAAAVVNDFPRRLQLKDARIFLTDAAKNGTFLEALSEDGHALAVATDDDEAPRHLGTAPGVGLSATFGTFASRYEQIYNRDASAQSFLAHSYDAIYALALAAAWASGQEGDLTGATLAQGLAQLSAPDVPATAVEAVNFSALQKALLAGEAVNLDGASGPLDFDPATGDVTGVIELWKVDGDSFSTVAVVSP